MNDDDRRLSGSWQRFKTISLRDDSGREQSLSVGFNDDEDPFIVMRAIGRIAQRWIEARRN